MGKFSHLLEDPEWPVWPPDPEPRLPARIQPFPPREDSPGPWILLLPLAWILFCVVGGLVK